MPRWRQIIDLGLKHRNSSVQEAAANAMAVVSRLVDCSLVVQRYVQFPQLLRIRILICFRDLTLIKDFRAGSPMHQQSLARVLGQLDYTAHQHGLPWVVQCLLESVKTAVRCHLTSRGHKSLIQILSPVTAENAERRSSP